MLVLLGHNFSKIFKYQSHSHDILWNHVKHFWHHAKISHGSRSKWFWTSLKFHDLTLRHQIPKLSRFNRVFKNFPGPGKKFFEQLSRTFDLTENMWQHLINFHTSANTYCLPQRHLVNNRSVKGSSVCRNVDNNKIYRKVAFRWIHINYYVTTSYR